MKIKKMSTYPYGKLLSILIGITSMLLIIPIIALFPENAGKIEFVITLSALFLSIFAQIYFVLAKYWDCISFSDDIVWHKKEKMSWNEAFITANARKIPSTRVDGYYLYFGTQYFPEQELKSEALRRNGFWMLATYSRIKFILSKYNKEVKIYSNSSATMMSHNTKKVLEIIEKHNEEINMKMEKLNLLPL